MRLVESSPELLVLQGRRRARAPVLVGAALIGFAALPLGARTACTVTHLACAAVLAVFGLELLRRNRPRRLRLLLGLADRSARFDGRVVSVAAARALVLGSAPESGIVSQPTYCAQLRLPTACITVLAGEDPAAVLRDVAVLAQRLSLPVQGGWGLPDEASPWRSAVGVDSAARLEGRAPERVAAATAPAPMQCTAYAEHRPVGAALLVAGGLLAVALVQLLVARVGDGAALAALSICLGWTTVALLALLGAACLTRRTQICASPERLRVSWHTLGTWRRVREWPRAHIRHAYAVGPDGCCPRHVLLETTTGLVSVPVGGAAAHALVRALGATLAAASLPTDSAA
jgi:hypothetical protein